MHGMFSPCSALYHPVSVETRRLYHFLVDFPFCRFGVQHCTRWFCEGHVPVTCSIFLFLALLSHDSFSQPVDMIFSAFRICSDFLVVDYLGILEEKPRAVYAPHVANVANVANLANVAVANVACNSTPCGRGSGAQGTLLVYIVFHDLWISIWYQWYLCILCTWRYRTTNTQDKHGRCDLRMNVILGVRWLIIWIYRSQHGSNWTL